MSLQSEIASLPRSERLALFARAVAYQKRLRTEDFVGKYRGDPLGFITNGLRELREDSWAPWRTVLKAAYGQPLDVMETAFFRQVAERDPPSKRVKELWLIVGRRGGKDSVASMMTLQAAVYADEGVALRPGERIMVPLFATNKTQAGIVFRYMRGYFEKFPRLRTLVEGRLPDSFMSPIRLKNNVDIVVFANNFRAPRGYPIGASVFDECAFWRSDDSATPDVETYNAILPGTATVPNSMIIGISSPYRQAGMLFKKWQDYWGAKGTDEVLVIRAPTATFNPGYDRSVRERMELEDPEAAAAEFEAEWRKDLADFVPREVVEACVVPGRFELPQVAGTQYLAFCDPSGGSSDSMTLAIGHHDRKTDRVVLDLLREVRAPFGPEQVVDEFSGVLKHYKCYRVRGDHYAGEWPTDQFKIGRAHV